MIERERRPVLEIEQLQKAFGGLSVTDAVSLTVFPGEVHALIGPNGAGKTSLVAQVAGTLTPDGGAIRLDGVDVTRHSVSARARFGLGRVFQIANVIGPFTALENVTVAAQARDGSSFRFFAPQRQELALCQKAQAALDDVGLGDRANVRTEDLAHGEKRALELAMCLVQSPRLLLLDEPMAGTGREETLRLTRLLHGLKGKIPMLLVEHDMATVFALADRVTVLVGGAVLISGTPNEVRGNARVRSAYLGDDAA